MDAEQLQGIAFEIILGSGDARNLVHESFKFMRESDFEAAEKKLDEANESLLKAHGSQTGLLHKFAGGEAMEIDILMVHAQDHLMTTMTLREMALEMMFLYQKLDKK